MSYTNEEVGAVKTSDARSVGFQLSTDDESGETRFRIVNLVHTKSYTGIGKGAGFSIPEDRVTRKGNKVTITLD